MDYDKAVLRTLAQRRGYMLKISKLSGLPQSQVWSIFNGRNVPLVSTWAKISAAIDDDRESKKSKKGGSDMKADKRVARPDERGIVD